PASRSSLGPCASLSPPFQSPQYPDNDRYYIARRRRCGQRRLLPDEEDRKRRPRLRDYPSKEIALARLVVPGPLPLNAHYIITRRGVDRALSRASRRRGSAARTSGRLPLTAPSS